MRIEGTQRATRLVYWVSSVLFAWLLMQVVHESGHVLGAIVSGGHVVRVVLHPFAISRTDVSPNPRPLLEVWSGPIWGELTPVAAWLLARRHCRSALTSWLRFFAGFCLIANGCHLGYGIVEPIGDADELVRLGTSRSVLGLFGLIAVPCGLRLWHGLGPDFGIGMNGKSIPIGSACTAAGALAALVVLELYLSVSP